MKKIILILGLAAFMVSCQTQSNNKDEGGKKTMAGSGNETKMERNKKTIMASMDALVKGDVDAAVQDAAPDFIDYTDGSMPPVKQIDSVKSFIKMLMHSIELYKPENTMLLADGDYVAAYATWTGIFKNDLMGIKASGKAVRFPDVDIFKFNEAGKIIEHRSVQNTGAVLMASSMEH